MPDEMVQINDQSWNTLCQLAEEAGLSLEAVQE
jgi:hypothetical protein